ncbi:methylated-DNA-protein-cysteine methyltransferase related protein [Filimonas lacunae]|uniref:Methylated-DNA-protein-cysteine methyltransferase related protein n=1 Tax=Filimonas lacunae TaxID=477680 RepID=A0A173MQM9_9BACT|nr:MGMT family protein [Filimonas lacunae]BAV09797.1 methylated-DNA--protein-cysteine S-methyltransferase [Filimonas lacunae]SIS79087.1 methylated-DNA-protein-cysteine methyltransferase related protein [Filimonas lacunae]
MKKAINSDKAAKPEQKPKQYSFFENVWAVVRQIPKGRVTSYGAIARYLGTGLSARMVGWALFSAEYAKPKIPAHRVVNRNGMLTAKVHFKPPSSMQEKLEKEGLIVENDTIKNFKERYWDPTTELTL